MANTKKTSPDVATIAAQTLRNPDASDIQKSFAASALAQSRTGKQTGADMEAKAGKALNRESSAATTKILAASLVSQSNKKR